VGGGWWGGNMIGKIRKLFIFGLRLLCDVQNKISSSGVFLFPIVNPLNDKLNPICHFLALLGAHLILHFSRLRVVLSLGKETSPLYALHTEGLI